MSRRKYTPPPSSTPGLVRITVVCTDKGQHSPVRFGEVKAWPDGENTWTVDVDTLDADRYSDPLPDVGVTGTPEEWLQQILANKSATGAPNMTWQIRCPRCRRNRPLRTDTLNQVIVAVARAGKKKWDISS